MPQYTWPRAARPGFQELLSESGAIAAVRGTMALRARAPGSPRAGAAGDSRSPYVGRYVNLLQWQYHSHLRGVS
jgi:hypothetical protein